jgi:hypothetical protein
MPLGNADMDRSSKAWDAIAIAALGTELQVLRPNFTVAVAVASIAGSQAAAGVCTWQAATSPAL